MPSVKALFLTNGILGQIGDRMWFFAAYLLLAKAFPGHRLILGAIYGLAIAVSTAVFASSVGSWIDRTPRLHAAISLLIVQNLSVAIAAIIEIFGITQMLHSPVSNYVMIGFVTLLGCTGMLGHVGVSIVLERDWIPQVFKGEGLTDINAWVRMIDQGAMLLGPALAGAIIGWNAAWGAGFIALWNVISLVIEISLLKQIYNSTEELQVPKDSITEDSSIDLKTGIKEWSESWSLWFRSPTFIPGLALALLFTNVFQLSYIAQGYITLHCISDYFMAVIWISSGLFGLLGTYFYKLLVGRIGLLFTSVVGGILHISFVFGTIGGLFTSGSHYAVYQQGFDYNKEACIEVETASQMLNRTDLISNAFILNYETDCAPPDSLLSIIILISCCALSRCGLWLFDLAVNQMFQEWVKPNQRGVVSGAQNGVQNLFDCLHFGIVFVWGDQCEFGHAMILTCILMVIGYSNLFLAVGMGKFESVQVYNDDENETPEENEEMMKKSSIVKLSENSRDEVEIISSAEEKEKMLKQ